MIKRQIFSMEPLRREKAAYNQLKFIADHYGPYNQVCKTFEELKELGDILDVWCNWFLDEESKKRYVKIATERSEEPKSIKASIVDEVADVLIMIEQLKYLLGLSTEEINERIEYKLNRQVERIFDNGNRS